MVGKFMAIAEERIAEGRRLYELTQTPVPDIAAMMGVSPRTLARRVHQWRWTPRSAPRLEADRAALAARPAPAKPAPPLAAAHDDTVSEAELRSANAMHIQRLVAEALQAVGRVLANAGPADESGAERSARTLAAVARTLQEFSTIRPPISETPPDDDADDDHDPIDIDEFRRELAQRLRGIIDIRRARISGRLDGPAAVPETPSA
jgi:hypothetical protein